MKKSILLTSSLLFLALLGIPNKGEIRPNDTAVKNESENIINSIENVEVTKSENSVAYTAVNLEEWIESRESWEQTSPDVITYETINLEEWVESRESWEQESPEMVSNYESINLEEWIENRESWEQKPSDELTNWIDNRESWEES